MRREGLLDLENRKNKRPGAYCTAFPAMGRPFILGNATGINDDVFMLFHESGHAFHTFAMADLPYAHQKGFGAIPMEFAEVASMGMELLAAPYLSVDEGGFYSRQDAARARLDHLQTIITLLPWIAAVDAFQHWVYENPTEAEDPERADACWEDLIRRFLPFVDWSGLEAELRNDWRRIPHLFGYAFYFLEYGLAQLGALQVWVNARRDGAEAVRMYLRALSLGGTRTLPELFEAAGARFAFDEETIRDAVILLEGSIGALEREQDIA
jgi:oligoendopeptidase F